MITYNSKYNGAALFSIIESSQTGYSIKRILREKSGFYLIDSKLPLMIKYATKRISPWSFTIRNEYLLECNILYSQYSECLLLFVCGDDGIAAVAFNDLKDIFQINNGKVQKAITISRRLNEMYNITTSDGHMSKRISKNSLLENMERFFYNNIGSL